MKKRIRAFARTAAALRQVRNLSTAGTNPEQDRAADLQVIREAIHALPAGQRQAVELLKLDELSLKEAAAATGVSVGALRVATHRAMASLRRTLGGRQRDAD